MHGSLVFNLPEDQEAFEQAQMASQMSYAIEEVYQRVFRPASKHGYPDKELEELIQKIGPDAHILIAKLKVIYFEVLEENNLQN